MAIFKKDTQTEIQKIESERSTLLQKRDRLIQKEASVRSTLDEAKLTHRQALREDQALDEGIVQRVRDAEISLTAVRDVLDQLTKDIAQTEANLAAAQDQDRRLAEANICKDDLEKAQAALAEYLVRSKKLAEAFAPLANAPGGAAVICAYANQTSAQLESAGLSTANDILKFIDDVLEGRRPPRKGRAQ